MASLDIFLNAFDNTGPASQSASANIQSVAATAVAADTAVAGASRGFGSLAMDIALLAGSAIAAGAVVIGAGALIAAGVTAVATTVTAFVTGAVNTISEVANSVGATVQSMIDGTFNWTEALNTAFEIAVTGFATVEFAITNWSDVAALAGLTATLHVVRFANQVHYFFTEVVPTSLKFVWDNWKMIFDNVYNYTTTVFSNMWDNVTMFFENVWAWLSGEETSWEWKGLTDGFEISMMKLPEIAERTIGPFEEQLEKDVKQIGDRVGEGLTENINKRLGQYRGARDSAGGPLGLVKQGFESVANFFKGLGFGDIGGGDQKSQLKSPELVESRFLTGATAAQEERFQTMMLDEAKKQTNALGSVVDWIGKQFGVDVEKSVKAGVQAAGVLGGGDEDL